MTNIKEPKECICCGGTYEHIRGAPKGTYSCTTCKHIYRHSYMKTALEFHSQGGDYRKGEYDTETGMFKDIYKMPTKVAIRRQRVNAQLSMVSEYISKEQTALEVASGKGFLLTELKDRFSEVTGMDLHPAVAKHNNVVNPHADFIVCDYLKMKEEKKYDVILAFDVMEHIEDANKFVEKTAALANEYAIIQVPADRKLKPINPGFDGHVHYFSEQSLKAIFTKNNLFDCMFMYKSKPKELANGREILAVFKVKNQL
jgi:hypothetical protein